MTNQKLFLEEIKRLKQVDLKKEKRRFIRFFAMSVIVCSLMLLLAIRNYLDKDWIFTIIFVLLFGLNIFSAIRLFISHKNLINAIEESIILIDSKIEDIVYEAEEK